jgi:hypothetical protein
MSVTATLKYFLVNMISCRNTSVSSLISTWGYSEKITGVKFYFQDIFQIRCAHQKLKVTFYEL